jgi:hypothetical protein
MNLQNGNFAGCHAVTVTAWFLLELGAVGRGILLHIGGGRAFGAVFSCDLPVSGRFFNNMVVVAWRY